MCGGKRRQKYISVTSDGRTVSALSSVSTPARTVVCGALRLLDPCSGKESNFVGCGVLFVALNRERARGVKSGIIRGGPAGWRACVEKKAGSVCLCDYI